MYKIYTKTVYGPPGRMRQILRIMKLTTFIIFFALMQVSAATLAQRVTVTEKTISLRQLFNEINKQTGYNVIWSADQVNGDRIVPAGFNNTPLLEVLNKTTENTNLTYTIEDRTVVIRERSPGLLDRVKSAVGAEVTVTAKVYNELGQPMAGVTVRQKDSQNGTTTDAKGGFTLTVPDNNAVLVFSFVGYETVELRAKDIVTGSIITLKVAVSNLKEVVINKGYYNESRELSTGDVNFVTAKEIAEQPVANVLEALQGRVPGLVITQNTGLPGGNFSVQLRGQSSFQSGSYPIYIIDGVPYSSDLPSTFPYARGGDGTLLNSTLGGGNPLNYLNPYDIESVEVLKDADATSIYGSRAANGAILITTKKGKAGRTKVDLNIQSGFSSPGRTLDMLNTQQYLTVRKEAFKNDGLALPANAYDVNGVWDTTRYTNFTKMLTENTAHFNNAQVSLSGGSTNTQFLVGAGYSSQNTGFKTLIPNDGVNEQGSVHFNINHSSEDQKLKLAFTGSYNSGRNTVQGTDFTRVALGYAPDTPPLFNADGSLNWAPLAPGQVGTFYNQLSFLYNKYRSVSANLVGNAVISYELLRGLQIRSSFGYTNTQIDEILTNPTLAYDPGYMITSGSASYQESNTHSWNIEPQIDYHVQINKGIFSALLGSSFLENTNAITGLQGSGYISDALLENPQSAGSLVSSSNSSQYKYNAIRMRLNYNWEDKYIINLTANRDGSSRFGPGKQFGNFWSAGAAWIFSKETLIAKSLPFLSTGKLRGSYGTTGNDQILNYQFMDIYQPTLYPYNGTGALYPQTLFNPSLAWEIDRKLEVGLELGFLKDRIIIEASYYRNRSGNQLVSAPVSSVTGYTSINENLPATIQNSGTEILLNTVNIKAKDFSWLTSFNLSFNHNKLLSFPGLATSGYQNAFIIGQPITIMRSYHLIGVNPTTGVYQFATANGTPTYSPNPNTDRTVLTNIAPKFTGGFQNSIAYHGFTLDFLFEFRKQTGVNLFGAGILNRPAGSLANIPLDIFLHTWHSPGDQAIYEKYTQSNSGPARNGYNFSKNSDFIYGDASFIRLRNVSFSWELPGSWQRKVHLRNCKLFIHAQNLWTITGYNGIDPESQNSSAPPSRVWTTGLQVGL